MYPTFEVVYAVVAGVVNEPGAVAIYVAGAPVKVEPAGAVVNGLAVVGAAYVAGVVAYVAGVAGTVAYVVAGVVLV